MLKKVLRTIYFMKELKPALFFLLADVFLLVILMLAYEACY